MRFEEQACQVLAFSISEEVEKRPFAPLIIESSQNFFFNEFPETNLVLFTLMESVMQTFFRCEIAWISITEIAT